MNMKVSHDAVCSRLSKKLGQQRKIGVLTVPLTWAILFLLSHVHGFSLFLAGIAWNGWMLAITHLITCLSFLHPRVKNQPPSCFRRYPVSGVMKIAKKSLICLGLFSGPLVLLTAFIFTDHHYNPASISSIFSDFFALPLTLILIDCCSALIIDAIVYFCLGQGLIFKFGHSPANFIHNNFNDNHLYSSNLPPEAPRQDDWYNDVTNPASPVYRATYRRPEDY